MAISSNTVENRVNKRKLLLISDICLIIVAALWGSSYGISKISLQYYPILGFLTIRFGLTSFLLLPVLLTSTINNKHQLEKSIKAGLPLGLILFAIFIFETYGLYLTTAANAAFLISLCIIMTPFLEWLILKHKPHKVIFLCAIMSLIGTYFLVLTPDKTYKVELMWGDYLILIAAFGRGMMVTMTKKLIENKTIINKPSHLEFENDNDSVSVLVLTAVQSIVVFLGSLLLFIISTLSMHQSFFLPTTLNFWLPTLFLILFCTIFAFFIQNWAINIGSPSRASLLMGTEPLFGAVFAVLFFNEQLSISGWIGGLIISFSSILLILKR